MKKLFVVFLALIPLAVVSLNGIASASAAREPLRGIAGQNPCDLGAAAGKVVINNPNGDHNLMVDVTFVGAEPGAYDVWLGYANSGACAAGHTWANLGSVTVDGSGSGYFHFDGSSATGQHWFVIQIDPHGNPNLAVYQTAPMDKTLSTPKS